MAGFSGGMRRRVEVAKGLLHRPRLLLMDEPSTGLDPAARIDLWRIIRDVSANDGVTVLVTTHLMEEADALRRLAVLDRGRLLACDRARGPEGAHRRRRHHRRHPPARPRRARPCARSWASRRPRWTGPCGWSATAATSSSRS